MHFKRFGVFGWTNPLTYCISNKALKSHFAVFSLLWLDFCYFSPQVSSLLLLPPHCRLPWHALRHSDVALSSDLSAGIPSTLFHALVRFLRSVFQNSYPRWMERPNVCGVWSAKCLSAADLSYFQPISSYCDHFRRNIDVVKVNKSFSPFSNDDLLVFPSARLGSTARLNPLWLTIIIVLRSRGVLIWRCPSLKPSVCLSAWRNSSPARCGTEDESLYERLSQQTVKDISLRPFRFGKHTDTHRLQTSTHVHAPSGPDHRL